MVPKGTVSAPPFLSVLQLKTSIFLKSWAWLIWPTCRDLSRSNCFCEIITLEEPFVRKTHLHQAYKHCAIGAMPSQTYQGNHPHTSQYTLQAGLFSISSQWTSWQLSVKSENYEQNSQLSEHALSDNIDFDTVLILIVTLHSTCIWLFLSDILS